jgi:proteasome accessory factor C
VGRDHTREAVRTFRVTRIVGPVRFLSEKTRDFYVPADYDHTAYRARPPWLLGPVAGSATISVGDDLAWYVERLSPHVQSLPTADDVCDRFLVPYADPEMLLSWVVGLGGCAEVIDPPELRSRLLASLNETLAKHEGEAETSGATSHERRRAAESAPLTRAAGGRPATRSDLEPIAPERLARAVALLHYLLEPERPALIPWETIEQDLGLTRQEIEADLSLINLVNFGGGTYAFMAEAERGGIRATPDVMADTFSRPARLSPLMARALLLALDLLGDALTGPGLESLAPVREKVRALVGIDPAQPAVVLDDVVPPDHEVMETLNRGIRDRHVVELEYLTKGRLEISARRVEPYLLFRSQEAWYLEAYCLSAEGQRTFKLERIRAARLTEETYGARPEVDLTTSRGGQAFKPGTEATWSIVRFQPRWRRYLEEQGVEFVSLPGGDLEARIPYADEGWMAYEVLRFLGEAVLIHPSSARIRVRELAAALATRYVPNAQGRESGGGVS